MAQTKVKLISNGVITIDNLHESHGITTDHIGEGTNKFFTDARVQTYLTSNNYIKTTDVASLETVTSISLSANTLSYVDEAGNTTNLDLSLYLDDTNLARLVSGTLDGATGIATFTRDDATTFTVDLSSLTPSETDPVYTASSWYTTTNNSSNWDTAYGWGDHASAGYATASSLSSYLPLSGGTVTGTTTFSSVYSGGTGDFTNLSNPSYKVSSASGYWRIPHLSGSTITSGVYNFETGKSVYWGEPNDTGDYRFRGRTLYAETGLRAPSFYDYSDTNYYVDPNGTSQLNYLNITGSPNGASLQLGSNDFTRTYNDAARSGLVINASLYPHIDINANSSSASNTTHGGVLSFTGKLGTSGFRRWGIGVANYNPNEMSFGYFDNNSNPHYGVGVSWSAPNQAKMWIDTGGNLFSTGSTRSPIFYDYSDTNYYIDPNSTSRTNVLTSFSLRNNYDVSTNHTYGMYFSNAGGESYSIFRESGAWSHPYPDLRIAFHTGIKLGAYYGYNGIRFYNNHDMVTQTASIGDGDNNLRGYYDIIAYASDKRLKEKIEPITNAVDKVKKLNGFTYNWNSVGEEYGWEPPKERESGVFAQEVKEVLPEAVRTAPFDQAHDEDGNMHSKSGENFLTVKYEKLVPLLIEAIKEQQQQIEELKQLINK